MSFLFDASGFSGPFGAVNGQGMVPTTMADLVRSALTCGHLPPGTFIPYPSYTGHSALWRASLTQAFLTIDPTTGVTRPTDEFGLLEPTERSFVSWMLGSSLAHRFFQVRALIPVLLHLTTFKAAVGVTFAGGRRPDYIAPLHGGGWAVVEAKGRSVRRASTLVSAKDQARSIATIGAAAPSLFAACVAIFRTGGVEVVAIDPPGEPISIDVDLREAYRMYFQPVLDLLDLAPETAVEQHQGLQIRVADVPGLDLKVGLAIEVQEALAAGSAEAVATVSNRFPATNQVAPAISLGPDGVFVSLGASWNPTGQ